jgi:hypothetical protein
LLITFSNQSTDGAEFVWVSECQKGEGCKTINQFVCKVSPNSVISVITIIRGYKTNCNTDIQFNVYLASSIKKTKTNKLKRMNWDLNSGPLASKASV